MTVRVWKRITSSLAATKCPGRNGELAESRVIRAQYEVVLLFLQSPDFRFWNQSTVDNSLQIQLYVMPWHLYPQAGNQTEDEPLLFQYAHFTKVHGKQKATGDQGGDLQGVLGGSDLQGVLGGS